MAKLSKLSVQRLIDRVNRKDWWHVPPRDPHAFRKRGKFLASSFSEAELYGRPLDQSQRVKVSNPLVGDEDTILRTLFGKVIRLPEAGDDNFLEERLALDARMKEAAVAKGCDAIVLMHHKGFAAFKASGKIPRSIELNLLMVDE